jgi:hypothetical protein
MIVSAVINLATLVALPEARDELISLPSVVTRYSLAFVAGVGFAFLRKWALVVYVLSGIVQWFLFFAVYGGVSQTIPVWASAAVSALVIAVTVLNWRQLRW